MYPLRKVFPRSDIKADSPAKLYRHSNSEWKDHGPGLLRIIESSSPRRFRILMRRDGTLKVIFIAGRCFSWLTINEFSDGVSKQQILAAKFRDFEAANNFKRIFDECVEFANGSQKDLTNKSGNKMIKVKPTYPSGLDKENRESVDSNKKENLSSKSPSKEILPNLKHAECEVLSDSLSNVKLTSQDDKQE
ncbi:unnamed protein product [Rodentolepis nana]|uniref:RanBD1 domain-containing protein n=1 Tax=Rodentolepis nana TaxID=102285 RepID=A0A0R3T1M5_RODNA|nr:unnamed protein product [Rodentolepis nana]